LQIFIVLDNMTMAVFFVSNYQKHGNELQLYVIWEMQRMTF